MDKTVSVIVPAYNAEKTIRRCIDGLIDQTFRADEIIVIDDGSTDNTGIILDQYEKDNDNIRVIHQTNAGVSAARNRGLAEATSDSIIFVDSDDRVGEQYVETLMQYVEYDFVTCGFHLQNPMLVWEDIVFSDERPDIDTVRQHPSRYMGKYYFGTPWAKLYKKAIIDQLHLTYIPDIYIGEDTLFIFSYLFAAKNIRIVPVCDYYYYHQESSLSNSGNANAWRWRILQEKEIVRFFDCSDTEEVSYLQNREFGVLRDLLKENGNSWTNEQIHALYEEPFFKPCIQYKKGNSTLEESFFLYSLKHNIYPVYERYRCLKKYCIRGKNHLKRKFSRYISKEEG